MNFEEALKITDAVVFEKTGKHLSDAQRAVVQGTWYRQKYHEIALAYRCTPEYLKQDVGPKLWRLLSDEFGEKVSKTNFRTVLERRLGLDIQPHPIAPTPEFPRVSQFHLSVSRVVEKSPQQIDWGEATDVSLFYGRSQELFQLEQWIVAQGCRVVAILGMGGIGKTSLSVQLAHKIQSNFQYVIWRSLRNAPPLPEILAEIIQFLSDKQQVNLSADIHRQISQLIDLMRQSRCLIILDNAESILQEGDRVGRYCEGYESYGELIKRLGETRHQSCLLLTSREKPREIAALEGEILNVRSLQLTGLETADCQALIQAKGIVASPEQWHQLIARYAGNPLAIKIVTTTIDDVFGGEVSEFLEQIKQGTAIFGDIRDLLEQQLGRLSELELEIMYWLAINREPISLPELRKDLLSVVSSPEAIESLESLRRRSLIEKSSRGFTQQPVVMEYIIEQFIEQIFREIQSEHIDFLNRYALIKSQAKDYIRESQTRVILNPIVQRILERYPLGKELQEKFQNLLMRLRNPAQEKSGYAGGNLINLCHKLELDLADYDFSDLAVWQAYLQDANLQNVNFSGADLSRSIFAETLGNTLTVALGLPNKLATGDADGKILLWNTENGQKLLIFQGKTTGVKSIAFSPEGELIASGSDDQTVRIWQVSTGECLDRWSGHLDSIKCVNFSPDGQMIASGSNDRTVRVWNLRSGKCLHVFNGHTEGIRSVIFSPDSRIIASSSDDQTVRLWSIVTGECLGTFIGNATWNWTVACIQAVAEDEPTENGHSSLNSEFKPAKIRWIASSCDENIVRLWDIESGQCFQSLEGHQDSVWAVAFSPDGELLASSSDDQTVRLWQIKTGTCLKTLKGFESQVCSMAFSQDHQILATGSQEQMVQLWDVATGQRLRTLRGHKHQVWSFVLSPDGKTLATGSDDNRVRLWDLNASRCIKRFTGHSDWVWSVAFSPDGRKLASGSYDSTVKLWDTYTGEVLKTLHGHSDRVETVVFSPDGKMLATASDDQTVRVWEVQSGECLHTLTGHSRWVGVVAFSPDGQYLASGSNDQTVKLWDITTGNCLQTLEGHLQRIHLLAFSPDRQSLASGSYDRTVKLWDVQTGKCQKTWLVENERLQALIFRVEGQLWASGSDEGQVRLWDVQTEKCVNILADQLSPVWSVSFHHQSQTLATASYDQAIRIWDLETGECLHVLRTDKPYHGMNITGVTGITTAQKSTLKALGAINLNSSD
ncbi:MAG: NB-ARC domain-containing protein [Lyngbya sp.]|nr:NB-ARC domain-containing protein [Lyngbya sp.]